MVYTNKSSVLYFPEKEDGKMEKSKAITESMEDYLETILELEKANTVARARDIADKMGVKRGSVTGALKNLKARGFINYQPYSFITLTAKGKKLARDIAYKHSVLKDFLLNVLQIDEKTADATACKMEHAIDKKTLERLICFIEYIRICPRAGDKWLKAFVNYCRSKEHNPEKCERCINGITWF